MKRDGDDSIAPKPSLLRGLQNLPWTVHGAIGELVDNALGRGRGNADQVVIYWDARTRLMTVVDNGVGMTTLKDLFRLGQTIGRMPNDIGEYGCGGTMALLYLASHVELWTLRAGCVAQTAMHWNPLFTAESFPNVPTHWQRATARNTPPLLWAFHHGTMIQLKILQRRRVSESQIRRDLSATFSPAVRGHQTVLWCSVGQDPITLSDPMQAMENVIPLDLTVEVDTADGPIHLHAVGQVGSIKDLPIERSRLAISFAHRVITWTRDCYSHSDGRTYSAVGVCGWLDLSDSWQGLFSTTKDGIDDADAYKALMDGVFVRIEPLLKQIQEQRQHLLLNDILLELQETFLDGSRTNAASYGDEDPNGPVNGRAKGGDGGGGETPTPGEHRPGTRRQHGDTKGGLQRSVSALNIVQCSDAVMAGCLARSEVVYRNDNTSVVDVFVNIDHRVIKVALEQHPINRMALALVAAQSIAYQIAIHHDVLKSWFSPTMAHFIQDELDSEVRAPYVMRLLMDRFQLGIQ